MPSTLRQALWVLLLPSVALAQQQALIGAWQCQTPTGPAAIVFENQGQLTYNGEPTQYAVQGNVIIALVDGFPRQYRYQIAGNQLAIANPDGSRTNCQRGGGGMAQAPAGGGSLNGALQGTLCSYSGSSGGGASYASTRRVAFDGRGRFATGSESTFSNNAGFGYGGGSGSGGTYTVTALQVGAPIRVRWNNGEDDQATVHFMVNGQITEIRYGKQIYGRGLCG
jgi:hypothetical protein